MTDIDKPKNTAIFVEETIQAYESILLNKILSILGRYLEISSLSQKITKILNDNDKKRLIIELNRSSRFSYEFEIPNERLRDIDTKLLVELLKKRFTVDIIECGLVLCSIRFDDEINLTQLSYNHTVDFINNMILNNEQPVIKKDTRLIELAHCKDFWNYLGVEKTPFEEIHKILKGLSTDIIFCPLDETTARVIFIRHQHAKIILSMLLERFAQNPNSF